ncbi:MAG: hypothetical protein ACRD5L_08480, partial [Bryobacteraceae bacterium]
MLLLAGMALPVISQAAGTQAAPAEKRANELTLSGLRPGRERLSVAQRKFDAAMDSNNSDEKGSAWAWRGRCKGWRISLEADGDGVIQTVDVSGPPQAGCKDLQSPERAQFWSTGRGLKLGDARERVVELYG